MAYPGLEALSTFCKAEQGRKELSGELRSILEIIAITGSFWHDWLQLKQLLAFSLEQVLQDYNQSRLSVEVGPPPPLVTGETFEELHARLLQCLDSFVDGPPFTLQRVCELLLNPRGYYPKLDKVALAIEKLLLVTSIQAPSREPYPNLPQPGDVITAIYRPARQPPPLPSNQIDTTGKPNCQVSDSLNHTTAGDNDVPDHVMHEPQNGPQPMVLDSSDGYIMSNQGRGDISPSDAGVHLLALAGINSGERPGGTSLGRPLDMRYPISSLAGDHPISAAFANQSGTESSVQVPRPNSDAAISSSDENPRISKTDTEMSHYSGGSGGVDLSGEGLFAELRSRGQGLPRLERKSASLDSQAVLSLPSSDTTMQEMSTPDLVVFGSLSPQGDTGRPNDKGSKENGVGETSKGSLVEPHTRPQSGGDLKLELNINSVLGNDGASAEVHIESLKGQLQNGSTFENSLDKISINSAEKVSAYLRQGESGDALSPEAAHKQLLVLEGKGEDSRDMLGLAGPGQSNTGISGHGLGEVERRPKDDSIVASDAGDLHQVQPSARAGEKIEGSDIGGTDIMK